MRKKKTTKKAGRKVVQSKKIIIDGIQFQSTLEGTMYTLLKKAKIPNTYEGKQFVTLHDNKYPEECYERKTKRSKFMVDERKITGVRYTPDFIGEGCKWVIEVKGRPNESFPIRWKLFKNEIMRWDVPPIIFKPTNKQDCEQVINILKAKGYGSKNS